jgi:hypothetical protein
LYVSSQAIKLLFSNLLWLFRYVTPITTQLLEMAIHFMKFHFTNPLQEYNYTQQQKNALVKVIQAITNASSSVQQIFK